MEKINVESLMIPLEEYSTIREDASMYEAVESLEKAQEEFNSKDYFHMHRQLLVLDKKGKVLGKISQLDVIRALEPKYDDMGDMKYLSRTGFSEDFIKSMMNKYALYEIPLADMCKRAEKLMVADFMYSPGEGEYVKVDASLREAVHIFVMGEHQSLLVTRDEKIVGILRLTDVFMEIFQTMVSHMNKLNSI